MRKLCICFLSVFLNLLLSAQNKTDHLRLFSPQELKNDIDSLYRIITSNHPDLWKYADKKFTDMKWEEAKASIRNPMTRWEFVRYVSPLLNQYHDGHTHLSYDFDYPEVDSLIQRKGLWFPYMVSLIGDDLFIKEEFETGSTKLTGHQLVSINGKNVKEIIEVIQRVTAGDYKENIQANISRLFPFFLWATFGWEKDYKISMKNLKGKNEDLFIPGVSPEKFFAAAFPKNDWSMQVFEPEGFAVIECRSYRNEKVARQFIDSAFSVIRERKIRKLAFDIRRNGGGNSSIGDYFLSYLTESPFTDVVSKTICDGELLSRFKEGSWMNKMLLSYRRDGEKNGNMYTKRFSVRTPDSVSRPEKKFRGDFYLLTGPGTYSSAHMTALAVKCFGLGKIVGQPTGERINLTGESVGFSLPNTKLHGYCATAVYTAPCGDTRLFGVQPDIPVNMNNHFIRSGIDPVISFLRKYPDGTSESLSH